jgi:hypothetical protein
VRQAPAALVAAGFGLVLCVAVAGPLVADWMDPAPAPGSAAEWMERRGIALDPPRSRRSFPSRYELRVLAFGIIGTGIAVWLASRQDRLDDIPARGLAAGAAFCFGVDAFLCAVELATRPYHLIPATAAPFALPASLGATVFAGIAVRARRSAPPDPGDPAVPPP